MPYDDFHRLDDNRRLGRFWLREEIPIPATKVIPANSEIPWLPYDQPHMAMGRYRDAPITYRTNAHGWRSREIAPRRLASGRAPVHDGPAPGVGIRRGRQEA